MWLLGRVVSLPAVADDEAIALKQETEDLRLKLEALRMADQREAERTRDARKVTSSAAAIHVSSVQSLSASGHDEVAALKQEAEDLQLKIEALRMADYREAQRRACGLEGADLTESSQTVTAAHKLDIPTPFGRRALPEPAAPPTAKYFSLDAEAFEGDDLDDMYDFSRFVPITSDVRLEASTCQQLPHEPLVDAKEEGDEHLLQLLAMTEELTDALEKTQTFEKDTQAQLAATKLRLQQEREQRAAYELELTKRDSQIEELQLRLREQEKSLAMERDHAKEIEVCPAQMGVEFDKIQKGSILYPCLEV